MNNKLNERTLKLTHEEIELIQRALGIAEGQILKLKNDYVNNLIKVNGAVSLSKLIDEETLFLKNLEKKFTDLNYQIQDGLKDV